MKSLILAFIFFGLLCFGLFDVKSYKASLRKATRRPGKADPRLQSGPIAPEPPPEDPRHYEQAPTRRYR